MNYPYPPRRRALSWLVQIILGLVLGLVAALILITVVTSMAGS